WANVLPTDNEYLQYDTKGNYVAPQGSSTTAVDFNPSYPVFVSVNKSDAALVHDNYIFGSVGGSSVKFGNAYNGKCFAAPIALVQRLNQGAYHPTYNSTGTGKQINTATNGFVFWDGVNAKAVTSTAMTFAAFDNGGVKDANSPANVGSINGASALSGSPSQYEFYDAIYAGQVKDLRLDANKKDLSKLLEDSSRSDIAATTRGWGKVPFTKFTRTSDAKLSIVDTSGAGTYVRIEDNSGTQLSASALISNTDDEDYTPTRINTYIYNATKNIVMYIGHISAGSNAFYIHTHPQFNTRYSGVGKYPVAPSAIDVGDDVMVCDMPFELTAEYDKLPWVDIIGSPANIAVTFPTGCVGQWIPEFPDGGAKTFNLNRKSDIVTGIITHKTTGNWLSENVSIDPTTNTITKFMATNQIGLIYYDSLSDFTAPAAHTAIVGDVRNVFVGCCSSPNLGNRLAPSLMIKVATSHDSSLRISNVVMEKYGMESSGELRTDTSVNFHATHDLIAPTNNSIGFKTLFTVVAVDGLYYLQYNGSELAYTSTSFSEWGDDETIQITDNDSTQLDTNDVTVANFCHHSLIPIGIAHN
ncbi:MAG: hypothetical protein MJH10_08615, partial [Epibacterium sp.]|nr:hypothetical protein [Epibacterium sp.]NQX73599.1 hypothetical protein [Epibacterium sp.]